MIQVSSKEEAVRIASNFDYVISILDPNFKWSHNFGSNSIIARFPDTEHANEIVWTQIYREVRTILEWARIKKVDLDSKLLVHCHSGVSRSSAIAWLLLIQMGMDMVEAGKLLYKQHPYIWPNLLVMSFGDTILNKGGELFKFACRSDQRNSNDSNENWS